MTPKLGPKSLTPPLRPDFPKLMKLRWGCNLSYLYPVRSVAGPNFPLVPSSPCLSLPLHPAPFVTGHWSGIVTFVTFVMSCTKKRSVVGPNFPLSPAAGLSLFPCIAIRPLCHWRAPPSQLTDGPPTNTLESSRVKQLQKIQPLKIAMGVPLLLYSLLLSFKTTTEAADIRFLSLLSYKRPFRSTYHFGTRHLTSYNETFSSTAHTPRLYYVGWHLLFLCLFHSNFSFSDGTGLTHCPNSNVVHCQWKRQRV